FHEYGTDSPWPDPMSTATSLSPRLTDPNWPLLPGSPVSPLRLIVLIVCHPSWCCCGFDRRASGRRRAVRPAGRAQGGEEPWSTRRRRAGSSPLLPSCTAEEGLRRATRGSGQIGRAHV